MSKDLLDKYSPTRIVAGPGSLAQLGALSKELGAARVLVVSDRGVTSAGHTRRGLDSLEAAGLAVDLYDGVEENPTTIHVSEGLERASAFRPDLLVGLGGGSAMDCAKGVNFVYSCGGLMADYQGVGKATSELMPMIEYPRPPGRGARLNLSR